jgi:hypothetical protein
MAKRFDPCPSCDKRGFYEIHGYLGNLPAGTSRCRYCYYLETPEQARRRTQDLTIGPRGRLSSLAERVRPLSRPATAA